MFVLIIVAVREVFIHCVELKLGLGQLFHLFVIIRETDSGDTGGQRHTQLESLEEIDLHFS